MHFGGHLSTRRGAHLAADEARQMGMDALQIFTQSPRMWRHPAPDPDAARRFLEHRARARLAVVTCHATYLINLASTDRTVRSRSQRALAATMEAAASLELDSVIVHVGSHRGGGVERALKRIVRAIEAILGDAGDRPPWLLFENTAGAGDTMGSTPAELEQVLDALGRPARVGICLDTCHLWAAGVDIADAGRVDELVAEVDERIGLDRLCCLHANDSATPLGSRRDRHENVGRGEIGAGMAVMLGHPRLQGLPAIMETPGSGHGPDTREVAELHRLHRNGLRRWARRRARA
jgi:deoxyribonuclease-4